MFNYLYLTLATIIYIVALPILILLPLKKKYKKSIWARFFLINNPPLKSNGLHFHVCSFGEARAIKSVIEHFNRDILRFSCITQTGFDVIKSYSKESRFLPYEIFLPFWIREQKALVVFEAELWYMLFFVAKKKGAKTYLINARVSEKSFPKYLRFKWLYKRVFENIDRVYAQSSQDAKRLEALGAKDIKVIGNIKFATLPKATKKISKNYNLVVTAGSTHEKEEELILDAFLALKEKNRDSQLIVVPRHPERFKKVESLLRESANRYNLKFSKYSLNQDLKSDIVLIDKMGELINAYAISDIVILGGAFANIGGHNAAEAAQFNCKIITGKNYYNQVELFKEIDGLNIIDKSKLKEKLLDYEALPKAKIKSKANIDELIEDLKSVL